MSTYPIALNPIADIVATGSKQSVIKDGLTDLHNAVESLVGLTGDGLTSIGFRRRNINGDFAIDQRNAGAAQTITAGAAKAYTVDRYYAYCSGANVSGQRVAGTLSRYVYQFTGAAGCTKIGFGHRMPASDTWDLAGKKCSVSVDLANSLLSTVSWTAWYANTEDAFGTLASPTRTQIATGTITVTTTMTRYSVTFDVPAAATTGIEIEFSVGAQTSGTWKIGMVQFESGSVPTLYEVKPVDSELFHCVQRFEKSYRSSVAVGSSGQLNGGDHQAVAKTTADFFLMRMSAISFKVIKRSIPTITLYNPSTGSTGTYYCYSASSTAGNSSVGGVSDRGFGVYGAAQSLLVDYLYGTHWTAEDEL